MEVTTTPELIRAYCQTNVHEDVTPDLMDKLENIGNELRSRGYTVWYMYAPVALDEGGLAITAMTMGLKPDEDTIDRLVEFIESRDKIIKVVLYKYYEQPSVDDPPTFNRRIRFAVVPEWR